MRTATDRLYEGLAWAAGAGVPALLLLVIGFVAWRGAGALVPALSPSAPGGGLLPAVAGTLLLVAGAAALAVPVGIGAGIHLAEAPPGRARELLRGAVELLASVPSILMGLLGFGAILLLRRTLLPEARTCLLLSAVCLAVLVVPYVVVTTASALEGLPASLRLLGPALGLSRWQSLRRVLLPAASRGILGGVILAVGRAAEDTAVILLTGVVATAGIPRGPGDRFEALPFEIFHRAAEHRTPEELDGAFAAALILLLLVGALFGAAASLQRGLARRWGTAR